MKKFAYLFPGQGAQAQGMMRDIVDGCGEAAQLLRELSDIAGEDLSALLFDTPKEVLSRSDRSQLAITVASLLVSCALKARGVEASAAMGFSLGEFPALYSAGVLSLKDLILTVAARGKIMQQVCDEIATKSAGAAPGMTAVIGLAPDVVVEAIKGIADVYKANMNSVRQTVISGTATALSQAEEVLKAKGAKRTVRLAVAGPYHCPLMQKAADNFRAFIADIKFCDPVKTLFSNVTGKVVQSGEEAKSNAVLHLTNPVLWTSEEALLLDMIKADSANQWRVLEVGPGKVLSGLWRDMPGTQELACLACNSMQSLEQVAL